MLRSLITTRARARHLVAVLIAYAVAAVVMFGPWPGLLARVSDRCAGLAPFDVRGFWDADDARTLVSACGTEGRAAYLDLQLADLVYPLAAGAALLLTTALLLRRYGGRTWPLLLPVIAMTVLDYAENAGIWVLLLQWPDVNTAVVAVAGSATAIKRVAGFVAFGIPIVLGVVEIFHRGRSILLRRHTV